MAQGFKAGGFNPASPAGSEAYGEETTWNLEGGLKSLFANGRVALNSAVFFIDWNDLQLNVPNTAVPGQIYIANVGGASSKGVEFDLTARPLPGVDVYGSLGYTNATFSNGSFSLGQDVSGNDIPNTPDYTASLGVQYGRAINAAATVYGRADLVLSGGFKYDDANSQGQDAYSLTNIRGGVRARRLFVEGWVKNAIQHHLHSGGVRLRPAHAVGLHRRERRAAHVRSARRSDVLRASCCPRAFHRGARRERRHQMFSLRALRTLR